MIKRFGSFYVGHLDLENVGLSGTPVMDRRFSNAQLVQVYDRTLQIARTMEATGFDTLWLAEHHFQTEGYEGITNSVLLSVHLAAKTERLRFGAAFNIIPTWHPLRLAEDYATADWLTNGRIRLGVGRGYQTRELETFGAPVIDQEANRELFEEQVEVLFKALNNERFSHRGRNYVIPAPVPFGGKPLREITLVPRPRKTPVECFQPMVSRTRRGLQFMARHRMKGFTFPNTALAGAWQSVLSEHGRDTELGTDLLFSFPGYIADSVADAMRDTLPYREEVLKRHAAEGFPRGLTEEQIEMLASPLTATKVGIDLNEHTANSLYGSPEEIIQKLLDVQETYPGLEEVSFDLSESTPLAVILHQLAWFGEEVIRPFKALTHQSENEGFKTTAPAAD